MQGLVEFDPVAEAAKETAAMWGQRLYAVSSPSGTHQTPAGF